MSRPFDQRIVTTAYDFVPFGAQVLAVGIPSAAMASGRPEDSRISVDGCAIHELEHVDVGPLAFPGVYVLLGTPITCFRAEALHLSAAKDRGMHVLFGYRLQHQDADEEMRTLFKEIEDAGFSVRHHTVVTDQRLAVLCIRPVPVDRAKTYRITTLSAGHVPNFGDRLGREIVNQLLPAHATVQHRSIRLGGAREPAAWPADTIDLLIVGLGNSVFSPLLQTPLFETIRQSRRAIGIFGTQYRESIDPEEMKELLSGLSMWYARYLEDLLLFGGECPTVHLGDWLISAFPMSEPAERAAIADTLTIGPELVQEELPIDRLIRKIQSYRRVISTRLHPLLCALTSAEEVAYVEEREDRDGHVSGKFRSMLLDVFGFHFPEQRFFAVDRDAVREYKQFVEARMGTLKADLTDLGSA